MNNLKIRQLVTVGEVFGDVVKIFKYDDGQVYYEIEGMNLKTEKPESLKMVDPSSIEVLGE